MPQRLLDDSIKLLESCLCDTIEVVPGVDVISILGRAGNLTHAEQSRGVVTSSFLLPAHLLELLLPFIPVCAYAHICLPRVVCRLLLVNTIY